MTRRLNGRVLLYLLGGVILVAGGVYVLHGVQVQRSAVGLLQQADRAEKEGRLDQVETYLSRYLLYKPGDTDTLARYGLLLEKMATSDVARAQTVSVYEKVLRRDPTRREIRRRLVDLAMKGENFPVAQPNLKVLREDLLPKKDGELEYLLGRCREAGGHSAEAAALYEEARRLAPGQIEAHVRLARLLRLQLKNREQADRVMDGLVAANGRSARAFLERARYRKQYHQGLPGAAQDVARALELAPEDASVLLAAAEMDREKKDFESARGHLERGLKLHPRNPEMYRALADLEARAGRPKEAVADLERAVKALPEDLGLQWALADLLVQVGRAEEVTRPIKKLRQAKYPTELIDYLEACVLMSRGAWSEAAKALERVHPALGSHREAAGLVKSTLVLLGQCYERLGDLDQRHAAYRRAVAIDPDPDPDPLWVPARLGLAETLAALGKIEEAIEEYRVVKPREPGAAFFVARLRLLREVGRPAEERRWTEVEQALDDAARALPGSTEVTILRAEALAAQDRLDAARDLVRKVCDEQPKRVEPWLALAVLAERRGKPDEALSLLDEAERQAGDRVEFRLARAARWAALGGAQAAELLAKLEHDPDRFPVEDRARLWRGLAEANVRAGALKPAERLWRRLASEQPKDLGAQLSLFDVALRAGDRDAAERNVAAIRDVEGEDGASWRCAKAVLLIQRAKKSPGDRTPLAEARSLLLQAAEKRPTWSRIILAQAQVDELDGNPEGALKNYLRAIVELGERDPAAVRRAVELLYARQRYDQAALVLRKLRERGPISADLQRLAADVSLRTQDYGGALEMARKAVSAESKDYRDLIWLAQILSAAGGDQADQAEPLLRRAVSLKGEVPDTWVALILYLAGSGRKEKAEEALREAERKLPPEGAALALAHCHEAVGHADRARDLYQAALAAKPDDVATLRSVSSFHLRGGRLNDAEPLLSRIIGLKGPTADAAWARRLLATVMAAGGNYRQSLKAVEILGLSDESTTGPARAEASAEDLRTKAKVFALRPGRADRRKAIALLVGVLEREPATADDLFLLSQLYEADGDWGKAREQMLKLLNKQGQNPLFLAHYTRALLRHNRTDEARAWLARLVEADPRSPATQEVRARVLHAQGRGSEAATMLEAFARDHADQAASIAQLLEELDQFPAAEALFRSCVAQSKRPVAALMLARFLGRRGRTREALDLCEGAWKTCPPEAVANACITILYEAKGDNDQQQRVGRWIEEAIGKDPDKVSIQFDLANLRMLQSRDQDAEAIMKRIAQQDKNTGSPLNNLAWMLAVRGVRQAEALELINRAIAIDGATPGYLDTRALVHLAGGRAPEAIRDLEEAAVGRPKDDEIRFHLARAYHKVGKPQEAAAALETAKSLGLTINQIHPFERAAFRELVATLARR